MENTAAQPQTHTDPSDGILIHPLSPDEVGFVQIKNEILRDPNLSAEAKALYCNLRTNRPGWTIQFKVICEQMDWHADTLQKYLRELKRYGLYRAIKRWNPTTRKIIKWDRVVFPSRQCADATEAIAEKRDPYTDPQGLLFEEKIHNPKSSGTGKKAQRHNPKIPPTGKSQPVESPSPGQFPPHKNNNPKNNNPSENISIKNTGAVAVVDRQRIQETRAALAAAGIDSEALDSLASTPELTAAHVQALMGRFKTALNAPGLLRTKIEKGTWRESLIVGAGQSYGVVEV